MVLMMPTQNDDFATLGLDAEVGPYLTKRHDRTIARRLRQNLWPFREPLKAESQAVFDELEMQVRFRAPPRLIPYFQQFYFPLGGAAHRDAIWLAGHYLSDFTLVAPGRLRVVMRMGKQREYRLELEVSKRLDAGRLGLLATYAAEVTRRMQPYHQRYHARQMAGVMLGEAPPRGNYAKIPVEAEWGEARPPENVIVEALLAHWPEVTTVMSEHAEQLNQFLLQEDFIAIFDENRYA
ncbi:hypothetical protein [Lacticaseibacillus suibinensis]|uniref:hypothetical protein n=1 Tax=Lacticaseibacillus suibinensis TaxID=2486011 RepID=UPI0013DDF8EF|nr:hypothetical protein [Lacticaseibacillus suibinensis]